jgi:hypothetical protein
MFSSASHNTCESARHLRATGLHSMFRSSSNRCVYLTWLYNTEKHDACQGKSYHCNAIFCLTRETRRVRIDGKNSARDRGKQVFSTYYLPPRFGVSTKKPLYPKGLSALSRLFRTSRLGSVVCCLAIRKACCSTVSATCIESLSFCRSSAISFTLLVCSLFIVLRISSTKLRQLVLLS